MWVVIRRARNGRELQEAERERVVRVEAEEGHAGGGRPLEVCAAGAWRERRAPGGHRGEETGRRNLCKAPAAVSRTDAVMTLQCRLEM